MKRLKYTAVCAAEVGLLLLWALTLGQAVWLTEGPLSRLYELEARYS